MEFTRSTLLPLASSAAKLGFDAGRWGTRLGFSISRSITASAVQLGSAAVDYGLGWNNPDDGLFQGPTSRLASGAVQMGFSSIEWIVHRGIDLGETLTQSSINAAAYAVESISELYGDTQEASFSLGAFVQLVRRELADPEHAADVPGREGAPPASTASRSVVQVAQSLAAWAAIQTMTAEYQEKQLLSGLREIDVEEWKKPARSPKGAPQDLPLDEQTGDLDAVEDAITDVSVTSDDRAQRDDVHITTADIGQPGDARASASFSDIETEEQPPASVPTVQPRSLLRDRAYIRRMSKITLGSYGGAGLVFFGAPLPDSARSAPGQAKLPAVPATLDQNLAEGSAINAEIAGVEAKRADIKGKGKAKQLWETVTGAHDEAIFKHYAGLHVDDIQDKLEANDADISAERGTDKKKPRFWVLTDHRRREVVLALRGTMSLNELAIDLTCDPVAFSPASSQDQSKGEDSEESRRTAPHQVHEGFLKIAQQMGGRDGPVLRSVGQALRRNPAYSLVLTGHSLGAGVAALLALMWADPATSLTTEASGLPPNRPVHAYCFAIPCVTSAALSELARPLITSVILSYDFVSRLSLGSIRDLKKVSEWLMYAVDEPDQKCNNIVRKALRIRAGGVGMSTRQKEMEADWFLSLRKTLEATMDCAHLFPVGTIYHAFLPQDLTPPPDLILSPETQAPVRLFEVTDVAKAYKQIIFASNMLSCHLPHQYDLVVSDHL